MKLILATFIFLFLNACHLITDNSKEINGESKISFDTLSFENSPIADSLKPNENYFKGLLLYKKKQYRKSIDWFNKTIAITPNYAPAYHQRAMAKYALHNFDGLWNDIDTAIELNPNFAEAYFDRGIIKQMLESSYPPQKGCSDICKAYELGYPIQESGVATNCDCMQK